MDDAPFITDKRAAEAPDFLTGVCDDADVVVSGFRRLWELGLSTSQIVEIASAEPHELAQKVRAAVAALERKIQAGAAASQTLRPERPAHRLG